MFCRGRLRLRYLSRLSVRSMTITRSGKPIAVERKIFQNSVKTYLSSGRKGALMRMSSCDAPLHRNADAPCDSRDPRSDHGQRLAQSPTAPRIRLLAHTRGERETDHRHDDV